MSRKLQRSAPKNRYVGPSTRYQGSKRKLVPWFLEIFESQKFSSVADVMCGTGAISYMLKRMGKSVFANDYLRFNEISAQAYIENRRYRVSDDEVDWFLRQHSKVEYSSFVKNTFPGMYFTDQENQWLDRTICNIMGFKGDNKLETRAKRAIATHAVVQACLQKRPFNQFHRKNLYLRSANVQRSFGNSTTWETPFADLFMRHVKETNAHVFDNGQKNAASNRDVVKFRRRNIDLVYIDPPYFRLDRERKQCNYRFIYHFVEGLVRYDQWPDLIDHDFSTLPLKPNGNSTEVLHSCEKKVLGKSLLDWFEDIITNWPNAQIAFSYKQPGIPTHFAIKKMLEETGRDVEVYRRPYTYALNHRNGTPNVNVELLFVAR